jgi:hypothetical protein
MMVARRALVVAMLVLGVGVGRASADCAWLMWAYSIDQRAGEHYSIEAARPTNQECLTTVRALGVAVKNRGLTVSGGDPDHPELLFRDGGTSFKYFCLPDTVDPRVPKTN